MGHTSAVDRFAFGQNWQSFAAIADEESISEAQRGLVKLFPNGELRGARVFDVGCGSGLSMAAALRLGASQVDGVDIDPNSIEAARSLLSRFEVGKSWSVEARICSICQLVPMTSCTAGAFFITPTQCGAHLSM